MAPKKKSGKGPEEEDFTTKELLNLYKKACKELEIPISKILESKLNEVLSEDQNLPEILVNEKIGEFGARALCTALTKTKYYLYILFTQK